MYIQRYYSVTIYHLNEISINKTNKFMYNIKYLLLLKKYQ